MKSYEDEDPCSIGLSSEIVDDEEAALLPLFPDGDPSTAAEWRELFGDA